MLHHKELPKYFLANKVLGSTGHTKPAMTHSALTKKGFDSVCHLEMLEIDR